MSTQDTGRRSLAAVFDPPASGRGGHLTGILPPASKAPKPPTPPVPEPAGDDQVATARNRRSDNHHRATPAAEGPTALLSVAVYLPQPLLRDAKRATVERGCTYADLVSAAFETVDDNALLAYFRPVVKPIASGMPGRPVQPRGEAGIQRQLRLTAEQRDWLDAKTESVGAPSRSALVAAALSMHLGTA